MHLWCRVVRELKVAAGRAIPFGARRFLLVGRLQDAAAGREQVGFRRAEFQLRSESLLPALALRRLHFFRDLDGLGERIMTRSDRPGSCLQARQFAPDARFQFLQLQFIDFANGLLPQEPRRSLCRCRSRARCSWRRRGFQKKRD